MQANVSLQLSGGRQHPAHPRPAVRHKGFIYCAQPNVNRAAGYARLARTRWLAPALMRFSPWPLTASLAPCFACCRHAGIWRQHRRSRVWQDVSVHPRGGGGGTRRGGLCAQNHAPTPTLSANLFLASWDGCCQRAPFHVVPTPKLRPKLHGVAGLPAGCAAGLVRHMRTMRRVPLIPSLPVWCCATPGALQLCLEKRINGLAAGTNTDDLKKRTTALEAQTSALGNQTSALETQTSALETGLATKTGGLEKRTTALETGLATKTGGLEKRTKALETKLANLDAGATDNKVDLDPALPASLNAAIAAAVKDQVASAMAKACVCVCVHV